VNGHEPAVDDLDDEVLLRNVGVKLALESEALVVTLNGEGYSARRRALSSARTIARLAGQLVDALSEGGREGR
jgi:hypothetical protein